MKNHRFYKNKIFLILIGVSLFLFGLARLYYNLTDDFRIANITHDLPYQPDWQVAKYTDDEEAFLSDILSQKFTYLAKGAQSYVFLSEDGEYVIKFFKFKHLRPSWFFNQMAEIGLFTEYHKKLAARKERKLWGVFKAYKLAFDMDKKESGLLFIQLNISGNPQNNVTVIDKIGRERTIDLENMTFIIQRRGEPLRDVLHGLLKNGNVEGAEDKIGKIFDLYAIEYSRGFYDHDHGVMRNIGFAGDEPIHLDVGKLIIDQDFKDKMRAKQDALVVSTQIKLWIKRNYPSESERLITFIDDKIHALYDK